MKKMEELLEKRQEEPFELTIGIQEAQKGWRVNKREAVRGVIYDGRQLLMVHNSGGDYKFPGGGKKMSESHEEALIREIEEETGYKDILVEDFMGHTLSRYIDENDASTYFEMDSYYYRVRIRGQRSNQSLDAYEEALAFTPVFCEIETAIDINRKVLEQGDANPWVEREIRVLEELRKYI